MTYEEPVMMGGKSAFRKMSYVSALCEHERYIFANALVIIDSAGDIFRE